MRAPLNLEDYIFEEIFIKPNPSFNINKRAEDAITVSCDILKNEDQLRYIIVMSIKTAKKGNRPINYKYSIRLVMRGLFSFDPKVDEEMRQKMIQQNGSSILYGLARGFASQTTAIFPHGKALLPAMNFLQPDSRKIVMHNPKKK